MFGEWGAVCDDGFTPREGEIVCKQLGYNLGVEKVTFYKIRVSVWKTFAQFLRKKPHIFYFVALHFCAKNSTLRNHSKTSFRAKLRYSVLRNFAEQILIKRLIKGVNCIN